MVRYSLREREIIVSIFLRNNSSVVSAQREFRRQFPGRPAPTAQTLRRLATNLEKYGTTQDAAKSGRPRTARSAEIIAAVAEDAERSPETSTRRRALQLSISRSTLRQILVKDLCLFSSKVQSEHQLLPVDRQTKKRKIVLPEDKVTAEGDGATSRKVAKKAAKAAKKAARAAEKQQKKADHKTSSAQPLAEVELDVSEGRYGTEKLIQSSGENRDRVYTDLKDLGVKLDGQTIWVRARLQSSRAKGKQCFAVLRQSSSTVQLLVSVNEERAVSKNMVKFTGNITKESIVDIEAVVMKTASPVESCSVSDVELVAIQVWTVSSAPEQLPLPNS